MSKTSKKATSYLDTLNPAYESDTVNQYDPTEDESELNARGEGQLGKGHTEAVAESNNWEDDQRDAIGRAASSRKRIASKLRRIAREIEAINLRAQELDEDYEEKIDEIQDISVEQAVGKTPKEMERMQAEEDSSSDEVSSDEDKVAKKNDEYIVHQASHPLEHSKADDEAANMSSQTGDEEWIDIGPGEFEDTRDMIGRAASKK